MRIFENRIRRIVSETLNKFIINETFTNMKQLYHKMPINFLVNMVKVNSFFLNPSNHGGRGGQYYASLTRHKNSDEGFNAIAYASESEFFIGSYATITFNIPKMSRIHGISIRPFDYYGTYTDERSEHGHNDAEGADYPDNGVYSKVVYQNLKKSYDNGDYSTLGNYDEPEYYNMAEENIVSDTVKEIPNIFNYIDRIDVYFPPDLEMPEYGEDYYEEESVINSYLYATALCRVACGTNWEKKIVVNLGQKQISLSEFSEWLKTRKECQNNKYINNRANYIVNKPPIDRENFNSFYYDDDDEYEQPFNGNDDW